MAGEPTTTLTGNLTADPELRFTPNGVAVANFTVASTPRTKDQQNNWVDGEALFMNCSVWRQMGENVAESLHKGAGVVVTGKIKARSFETREGEKRTVIEMEVEDMGPSLKHAVATPRKVNRAANGGAQSAPQQQAPQQAQQATQPPAGNDPWAAAGAAAPKAAAPAGDNDPWANSN